MRTTRQYSLEERTAAVAMAANIGPVKAAAHLGIPKRTVTNWMHKPAASVVIARVEATIAERLKEAHEVALQAVLEGLRDPTAKLGDRAAALRVLGEQANLAQGRSNLNIELHTAGQAAPDELDRLADGLTWEERRDLNEYLERIEAEYEYAHPEEMPETGWPVAPRKPEEVSNG